MTPEGGHPEKGCGEAMKSVKSTAADFNTSPRLHRFFGEAYYAKLHQLHHFTRPLPRGVLGYIVVYIYIIVFIIIIYFLFL